MALSLQSFCFRRLNFCSLLTALFVLLLSDRFVWLAVDCWPSVGCDDVFGMRTTVRFFWLLWWTILTADVSQWDCSHSEVVVTIIVLWLLVVRWGPHSWQHRQQQKPNRCRNSALKRSCGQQNNQFTTDSDWSLILGHDDNRSKGRTKIIQKIDAFLLLYFSHELIRDLICNQWLRLQSIIKDFHQLLAFRPKRLKFRPY